MRSRALGLLKHAITDFFAHEVPTLASSLAFYTVLSLSPLLLVLLSIIGLIGPDAQQQFVAQVTDTVGPGAGQAMHALIVAAQARRATGTISSVIGGIMLLVGATGIFSQLQAAMNRIWNVKAAPGQGVAGWLRKRVVTLGLLLTVGFIMMISLLTTAAVNLLLRGGGPLLPVADYLIGYLVIVVMYAVIYKYLPDARIQWRDVWVGAAVTGVLFDVGRIAIAWYLTRAAVASAYGAAASPIILLLWVYYAALISFFGAELTQVWAGSYGHAIVPQRHARAAPAPT